MSRANVYIIAERNGPRKIGVSDDPASRILALRADRAPLSVVATYPRDTGDARIVERVAHRLLKEKRLGGEWFDVTDDQAIAAVREAIALVESGVAPETDRSRSYRRRSRGRPKWASNCPRSASIGIRLEPAVKAALEAAAKADHRPVASLIEKVMTEWLEANGYHPTGEPAAKRKAKGKPRQTEPPEGQTSG